jgi:hypothetical protein
VTEQTIAEYQHIQQHCRHLFQQKTRDYGTAWRILRLPSLTDQLFIKAQRIRSVQEKGTQKVADDLSQEFVGIINYSLMALIQLRLATDSRLQLDTEEVMQHYDAAAEEVFSLMQQKNHDYGEAWRQMRVSSITDIILMKLLRVKQIEDNAGQTLVSEGVAANYQDMVNYAVFALILSGFTSSTPIQ